MAAQAGEKQGMGDMPWHALQGAGGQRHGKKTVTFNRETGRRDYGD